MASPGGENGDRSPSPRVAELLEKVRRRVAIAPTVTDISRLARDAERDFGGDPLTVTEIRQLADVAMGQAAKVSDLMARLAELTTEAAR